MKGPKDFEPEWTAEDNQHVAEMEKRIEEHFAKGHAEARFSTVEPGLKEAIFIKVGHRARTAGWVVTHRGSEITIKKPGAR
jgi:hypothetical protein